jgi:pyrroline-5-carboxylate reductase
MQERENGVKRSLGFIGGGRITRILLGALRAGGFELSGITVSEPDPAAAKTLVSGFPGVLLTTDNGEAAKSEVVFLALHPPAMKEGTRDIRKALSERSMVISLSPKHSFTALSAMMGGFDRLARMIPNAACIVGKGYNPVSYSPVLTPDDCADLDGLFSTFGACPHVKEENLEAYAVLTAMGPTYFLFQIKEIMALVSGFGLKEAEIGVGMRAMLEGMIPTIFQSGLSMDEVIDLIPGKPMAPHEDSIRRMYESSLNGIYAKLKS